jgi:hypothetical protein
VVVDTARRLQTTTTIAVVHRVGTARVAMTIVVVPHRRAPTTMILVKTATGHHVADRRSTTTRHRHAAATPMIAMELHRRHAATQEQSRIRT